MNDPVQTSTTESPIPLRLDQHQDQVLATGYSGAEDRHVPGVGAVNSPDEDSVQEELFYTLWTVFGRSPGGTTSGTGAGTRTEMRSGGDTKHPTNSEIVETSRSVSLLGSVTSPSTSPSRMPLGGTSPQGMGRTDGVPTTDLQGALALIKGSGVTVRGFYDVSAMRAAGDVMVWLHGPLPERLQAAVRALHRTQSFDQSSIVWSSMGVHRMAEFAKDHSPAFVRGLPPAAWACEIGRAHV